MYRNFQENCYCIEYYRRVHCCQIQPIFCYISCCPCQSICFQTFRICPRTYRKLSAMPPKLNSSSETSSTKKSAKLKKRNLKSKKGSKNTKQNTQYVADEISLEDSKASNSISSIEYSRYPFNVGNNVRLTHSESVVGSRSGVGSHNSIKYSDSYCNYQCHCRPLNGCQGKPEINFNLVARNNVPIKQTHPGRRNYTKVNNEYYYNNLVNVKSPTSSQTPSYESRNSYSSEASINRRVSYDSPNSYTSQIKPNISTKSDCKSCMECQHIDFTKTACVPKSTQHQSCHCNCNLCRKASPTRTSPLRSARHSFSSSKSCPQLDIIKEEEPENEDHTNLSSNKSIPVRTVSRDIQTKPETQPKATSSGPLKMQKSLEDSCADFLNIVCDNILESVQKSVDHKLKEYCGNVKENFESLGRKVEKSESAVKGVCWDILEKMTEQNKNNFEQICALVQNLVENRTANQYAMTRNNCQDKECQCEFLVEEENADRGKNINNEDKSMEKNIKSVVKSANEDIRKEENANDIKSKWCNCCHCNDAYLTPLLDPDKTYPSKTSESETIDTPALPKTHLTTRSAGGCSNCEKCKKENIQLVKVPINKIPEVILSRSSVVEEDLKIMGLPSKDVNTSENPAVNNHSLNTKYNETSMAVPLKFPAPELTSPSTSGTLTSQHVSGTTERDTSLPKYTTFCLTPTGKTIFNCNCSAMGYDNNENKQICACKISNDTNMELKPICRNLYDNYDTSGYATEPEDNNDSTTNCNSARKKLQKKASKQHCSSQTMDMGNSGSGYDYGNEMRGSHIGKRLSKTNSCNPSPTRLSRL
ncbi:uncharacterized protein LOC119604221 [Lucilia sericata]|uniref:uncharacterized protein LOC119604221 n=1 Tax=Lucilia sericata TaxID=13632 RepID=UPI0018A7F400|nr:uncharacterized protein LOC119604221 [Lucilia sericata]